MEVQVLPVAYESKNKTLCVVVFRNNIIYSGELTPDGISALNNARLQAASLDEYPRFVLKKD